MVGLTDDRWVNLMKLKDEIRLEEYRSLLEEHKKNRSYVFERL